MERDTVVDNKVSIGMKCSACHIEISHLYSVLTREFTAECTLTEDGVIRFDDQDVIDVNTVYKCPLCNEVLLVNPEPNELINTLKGTYQPPSINALDKYRMWLNEAYDKTVKRSGDPKSEEVTNLVNAKLAEVLNGKHIAYVCVDWKAMDEFLDEILRVTPVFKEKYGKMYHFYYQPYAEAPCGGTDDLVLILCDKDLGDDEKIVVFDLVHNLDAKIQEGG